MKSNSFLKLAIAIFAFTAVALSTGCATHPGSGPKAEVYETVQAHQQVAVERGVIIQMKRVTIKGTTTGAVTGGGVGAIAGALMSRNANGYAKTLVSSLTALGGSLAGAEATSGNGHQLIIKKENGQSISIAQVSTESFRIGQKVLITGDGRVLAN